MRAKPILAMATGARALLQDVTAILAMATGARALLQDGHTAAVRAVNVDPLANGVFSAGSDCTIKVYT